ncbi:MAG: sigma 54-interacting transcriptional regulator [Proteobacteria bacterium]|nr:sigma 54-interacting transcriptional regulator [Pseudomonadota bacterium]
MSEKPTYIQLEQKVKKLEKEVAKRNSAAKKNNNLSEFPVENPNPVLRITNYGIVLYANNSAKPLMDLWKCKAGEPLPHYWRKLSMDVSGSKLIKYAVIECEERVFSLTFAPIQNTDYINVYGFDITEHKKAEDALREYALNLKEAQSIARLGRWEHNLLNNHLEWSDTVFEIFEIDSRKFGASYKTFLNAVHPDDREYVNQAYIESVKNKSRYGIEHRLLMKDGRIKWLSEICRTDYDHSGQAIRSVGIVQDITERKQIENAQMFLLQCGLPATGEDFFKSLARYLSETLAMDYVYINRLSEDGLSAHTVAVYSDGKYDDNVSYLINNTPCGDVVGKTICCFQKKVRFLFPHDKLLQEIKAESYVRTTLWSADGKPIGLIAVIGRRPLADTKLAESLLKLVAIRASGEIERRQADKELRESEEKYRLLFENITQGFALHEIILDESGKPADYRIISVNPAFTMLTGIKPENIIGKTIKQVMPKLEQYWLDTYGKVAATSAPVLYENYSKELGKYFEAWIISPQKGQFAIMFSDITERKLMSQAIQKANNELELRVKERTSELLISNKRLEHEIEEHRKADKSLRTALSEINKLKEQIEAENIYLRREIKTKFQFADIIGESDSIKRVLYQVEQVAPTDMTVLVLGETGTGKELISNAIHNMSSRKDRSIIVVNCAALPSNLIESELFGREKGAFTGADTKQIGRFEIANGSTLCLDEIGELPLDMQAKLLRAIQHGKFERLGSSKTIQADVRIVATTNRNLEEEVRNGRFRQDLYYRLNVFPITVPPLRERKEDIPLLIMAFVKRYAIEYGKKISSISKETMKILQDYTWPGNIREMESVIERSVILCQGHILQLVEKPEATHLFSTSNIKTLEEVDRMQILNTLSYTKWRINGKDGAAAILGLHPSTLRARMNKLDIRRPENKESDKSATFRE